tara:strand:- start:81 stop:263 length:183 start_codon:yes stop_codon:yes gene_type:complete
MGNYIAKAIIENYNQPKQNYNKSKNKFIAKFEPNNYDNNYNNYHNKNVRNINYANKEKND